MKIKELKEKKVEELAALLEEKREAVRAFRFDISAKQVKNHRACRTAKKDVAKIMTLLAANRLPGKK